MLIAIMITAALAVLIPLLYIFSTRGRRTNKDLAALRGWNYAHRGLHGSGVPENSMAAFRAALDGGYGIELDVHLMSDGKLAVIHDASLKRTAGADVLIEDLTAADLSAYSLEGTAETIPLFSQVLELFDGKAPMIIELKAERGNHAKLTEAVCDLLETYNGPYCLESFDPRCLYWLKKHRPEKIRGQLTQNFFHEPLKMPWLLRFILTHQVENFLVLPDFVAYRFRDRETLSNRLVRKLWHIQGVTWTIRTPEELAQATEEGWISIFENFLP